MDTLNSNDAACACSSCLSTSVMRTCAYTATRQTDAQTASALTTPHTMGARPARPRPLPWLVALLEVLVVSVPLARLAGGDLAWLPLWLSPSARA